MNTRSYSEIRPPAGVFLAASVVMFVLTLSAADSVGFVPCQIDNTCEATSVALSTLPQLGVSKATRRVTAQGVLPVEIKIPSVGIDLPVQNPSTTDVDALDALLNKGPARYVEFRGAWRARQRAHLRALVAPAHRHQQHVQSVQPNSQREPGRFDRDSTARTARRISTASIRS